MKTMVTLEMTLGNSTTLGELYTALGEAINKRKAPLITPVTIETTDEGTVISFYWDGSRDAYHSY